MFFYIFPITFGNFALDGHLTFWDPLSWTFVYWKLGSMPVYMQNKDSLNPQKRVFFKYKLIIDKMNTLEAVGGTMGGELM